MAIPTTSITDLIDNGKTPQEKFEVLKQNGYLTEYALENPQKFLDFLLIAEEDAFETQSRMPVENYGYNPNIVSGRLIGEGFIIKYRLCHLCGVEHEVGRLCIEFYKPPPPVEQLCQQCGYRLMPHVSFCVRCGMSVSN